MMESILFSSVASRYLEARAPYLKRSSFSLYDTLLNKHLLPRFGAMDEVSEKSVQAFVLDAIASGLSVSTVRSCVTLLKGILRYGAKEGLCRHPSFDVRYPSYERKATAVALAPEEARRLARFCRENFSFRNLAVYTCLSTGLRIGELCALRWKDIDRDRRVVVVSGTYGKERVDGRMRPSIGSPKTASSNREVPLSSSLWTYLKPFVRVMNPECFIASGEPEPVDPRVLRAHFRKVLEQAGIRPVRFHGLRHTFATRLIDAGCDVKTVSTLLGHANVGTTMDLYVHPDLEQKRKAVEKIVRILK